MTQQPPFEKVVAVRTGAEEAGADRAQLFEQRLQLEQAHARLRASFARYDELYELAPVGFMTLDRRCRIRELNENAARLLGFSSSWLIGRPFIVFIANHDITHFLQFLNRSANEPQCQMIHVDLSVSGSTIPVQISMKTSVSEEKLIRRAALVDLLEMKRIETDLQNALDNWNALVHNAPEVIMTIERDGKISFANRPVWGCSVSAMIGSNLCGYLPSHDKQRVQRLIDLAFRGAGPQACDLTGINGDFGSWFSLSFGPPAARTKTKAVTLIIHEISEQKRAEETLRLSSQQMREFAARLDSAREEERVRLAREIHDELGQALTILKLDLSWLQSKMPAHERDTRKKMRAMLQHVDGTMEWVRRIASELRPSILDDLGLVPALDWQVTEFRKHAGIKCHFSAATEKLILSPEASVAVFRVVQEALTNVARHAQASKVQIRLKSGKRMVIVSVADNGRGMPADRVNATGSLGIVGMKERIARVGGDLAIQSQPGKGTRVEIFVPIRK